MIITTTPSIEGRRIVDYRGIVFGEVVSGVDFVRDLAASFTNFFGGRSGGYEEELVTARQNALNEMAQRAASAGANAVVGVDVDYEVLGADGNMLMVTVSGTAVVEEKINLQGSRVRKRSGIGFGKRIMEKRLHGLFCFPLRNIKSRIYRRENMM